MAIERHWGGLIDVDKDGNFKCVEHDWMLGYFIEGRDERVWGCWNCEMLKPVIDIEPEWGKKLDTSKPN